MGANYKGFINYLKSRKEEGTFALSYGEIDAQLQRRAMVAYKEHHGVTKKSSLGKSILLAGFVFKNSYQDETITFEYDLKKASRLLKAKDTTSTKTNKKVFLNVVFPHGAEYVNTSGNVGHEIIDIFGGDNNEYHYYLNPWGIVAKDSIPEVVISICQASTGLYKILNKAVIKKPEKYAVAKKNANGILKNQKKKFKYNNKYLEEYYRLNVGGHKVLSSFECKGIYAASKPMYFMFESFGKPLNKKGFYLIESNEPGRSEKCQNFNQHDQDLLEKLVNDNSLWLPEPIQSFKEYVDEYSNRNKINYFKELGIENQELQYSNALKFFIDKCGIANAFVKNIGCDFGVRPTIYIERELYNIDLLLTNFNVFKNPINKNQEKIVIIENKIKANVTPSDNEKTLREQVTKIFMNIYEIKKESEMTDEQKNEVVEICNFIGIDDTVTAVPSQLSKYYIYAVIMAKKRGWADKKVKSDIQCFFLCPEYSRSMYNVSRSGYLEGNCFVGKNETLFLQEKYKLITYKNILPVFEKAAKKISDNKLKVLLEDFVDSIEQQAKDRDDSLEKSMIEMFYLRSR